MRFPFKLSFLFAALIFLPHLAIAQTGEQSFIYFDSTPGDYVGGGSEHTTEGGSFSIRKIGTNGVEIFYQADSPSNSVQYASLAFAADKGQSLQRRSYEHATRYPLNSPKRPGLSISANSHGCNTLRGEFEILELEYSGNSIRKFAANFVQYCDGGPALWGALRYRSTVRVRKPIIIGPAPIEPSDPTPNVILLKSPAGDYIGGGMNQIFKSDDGAFNSEFMEGQTAVRISYRDDNWWDLEFAAPVGKAPTKAQELALFGCIIFACWTLVKKFWELWFVVNRSLFLVTSVT